MDLDTTDENLMRRYAKGETDTFEVLYERHKGGVYRYFLRQCNDESIAQELFQDVWLKVINSRKRYQPTAKFSTWLYTLAHHRLVDWYRRQKIRFAVDGVVDDIEDHAAGDEGLPENELQRARLVEALKAAMCELPPEQLEVFVLHQERGFSVAEIAEIAGLGKEATKSRYRYAVRKLRNALEVVR